MARKATLTGAFTKRRQHLTDAIKKHAKGARVVGFHADKVKHAVECGKALSRLKDLLGHGGWNQWVENKCGVNRMTANRYIRLSNRTDVLKPDMTIREAYIAAGVINPSAAS